MLNAACAAPANEPKQAATVDSMSAGASFVSADDDHVLHPADDEDLAVLQETEIARSKESAVNAPQAGSEHVCGFQRSTPIAAADVRAADPDLTDFAVAHRLAEIGVDDHDRFTGTRATAGYRPPRDRVASAARRCPPTSSVVLRPAPCWLPVTISVASARP